ncbi:MAG: hypothetical protein ICV66_03695 [Chitinophagaceae bacterium]|nr:hypothetical protein [Chitinophagaceae bacterium]
MKFKTILTAVFTAFILFGQAQIKLPFSSSLQNDIQKIVLEYPEEFINLRGDILIQNPQSIEYKSLITPAGAEEAVITKYSSAKKAIYSWKAVMLVTENFDDAVKKYRQLFSQLNDMAVEFNGEIFHLKGEYEAPLENKKFYSSMLYLSRADDALRKLKVEVLLHYNFPEWKVELLVYEKEREDDERGEIKDDN